MTPERWQQIRDLLHSAMELEPAQRSAYLERHCSDDPSLRKDVDSFLASEEELRSSFLESPAVAQAVPGERLGLRMTLAPGTKLGRYEVVDLLGAGGMGEVYRARDTELPRTVAIKVLPAHLSSDPLRRQRFEREVHAISSLQHPNICTLHDVGHQNGVDYLVMEYLEGGTLASKLQKGPLPLELVLRYGIEIADALDTAHRHGIIHRDLKPGNIFLTSHGECKVLDFGLAKLEEEVPSSEMPTLTRPGMLTSPGEVVGTVAYMSPEQVRGEKLDARTDLFSFGVVLYEMATGNRPFDGDTYGVTFDAILNRQPLPAVRLNPEIAPDLERVIDKALEKDREVRYQHAADIRTDLQRLKRETESARTVAATKHVELKSMVAVASATTIVVGLAVGGWLLFSHKAHALTDKDTIVLADFANTTGEPVFDGTLREGLSVQLEQSPFLSLVSEEGIHQTLRMMGQPNARLTPEVAREVCQRTGSAAALNGSIALIGTQYNLILKAVSCTSGDLLASTGAQANDKSHVLDALGKVASDMREKLGESLSTVRTYNTPLEQATTPSVEALQAYSLGYKTMGEGDLIAALSFFQRATQLDPNFAMAYDMMGETYQVTFESALAAQNIRKALELRGGVSEREKLIIEGDYYDIVTGDLTKARRSYALGVQIYPRDAVFHQGIALVSNSLGQYEAGLKEHLEYLRLARHSPFGYRFVVCTYLLLNRVEDAEAEAKEAHSRGLDSNLAAVLYGIAFYRGDTAEMTRQAASAPGKAGEEHLPLALQADTAAYLGHLRKAREFSRQAADLAERAEEKETAATYRATSALREALFGNPDKARPQAAVAKRATGRDLDYGLALVLAYAGDANQTRALTDNLAKRFPEDTVVQVNYLPTLRAKLALINSNPQQALELLQVASPYELGLPALGFYNWPNLYPVYVRGEAYLAAHQGNEAAVEFQKILNHRGIVLNEPIGALAHLQLGRAYAAQGDTTKARAAYQDFLTLWKDADPDIPILKQAKAEYAKLR